MAVTQPNYGSSIIKHEDAAEDTMLSPLPRAVLRSNSYILLDGEWKFAIDEKDTGLEEGWHLSHPFQEVATWPGSIESHMAAVKDEKHNQPWKDKVVAWYERTFPIPEEADEESELRENLLQLTFGACGYETRVWLNGVLLTTIEGEKIHIGGHTSFSYELPPELLKPENRITVRIEDSMNANIPRGKQESHVYKRGGIWYQTYTGAVRSIWLELVERNRLRSRVGVESIVEDNLVRFDMTTRIHDPGQYTLRLSIYDKGDRDTVLASDDFSLLLEDGEKMQRVVLELPGAKLWSPEFPHLYYLVAQLESNTGHTSEIHTTFGLRKIEARGCCIYLNNNPIYLDGILYQPGTATYEQIKKHMVGMKALGCNLVRIHIAGVDPRIYNLADKLGMLLWVEVPSPHVSSKESRQAHKEELLRMLALIGTHPSVVIWSLYNEDWGAQDIAVNPETRNYIIDMYNFLHLSHPQFLVVDNDGWQHISQEGILKSDLLTAHLYTPEIEQWKILLDKLIQGQLEGVAAFPLVVGDPYFYRTQVPLIVSEWGGFGFADYGGPADSALRNEQIREYKKELRKRPFAGDVYTQATNIEDEKNGIIDFETGELQVEKNLLDTSAFK